MTCQTGLAAPAAPEPPRGKPALNASLTDVVFEVERPTRETEVNALFKAGAEGELQGILGYEERPLVSADYTDDPRSATVDAPSTLVIERMSV